LNIGWRVLNYKRAFSIFEIKQQLNKFFMESPAFFFTIFLWCLLLSITGYSIYVGFGPPSQQLRDPFEEHED
jgi:PsbN protein